MTAAVVAFRLVELAQKIAGAVRGDGEKCVVDLRTLEEAGPDDLSFVTRAAYRENAERSRAGALLVPPELTLMGSRPLLVAADPAVALLTLLPLFRPLPPPPPAGIHPTAIVGPACEVDPTATLGPYVVLGEGCRIGPQVTLGAHVVVGRSCAIGAGSVLHPHVVLYDQTLLGARVIVHAGAVLGADGFGYTSRRGEHLKVPQVGRTVIADDVEIGANSAIDRAMLEETRVGAGTKIDNLVQVGHNVQIGRGCILSGQVGLAGSTRLGDFVVMGGQSGAGSALGNYLELGSRVEVAGKSAVFHDVPAGQKVGGIPAVELTKWRRQVVAVGELPQLIRRMRQLERGKERDPAGASHPATELKKS